ncbi:MAG: VacJ family lipoprotein [Verrucomicrobiota bacterium]
MKKLSFKLSLITCAVAFASISVSAEEDYISDEELFTDDEFENAIVVKDPLEPINRVTFKFNDFVYENVLDPVASGYQWITPDPVEKGASNFFKNLRFPIRAASNLLQGRLDGAWVETGRFAINSTVGILGVNTPADSFEGFEPIPPEEFGQVLGAWGVSEGPYIVIPFLGPSNLRDAIGLVGDASLDPIREPLSLIDNWDWEWQFAVGTTELIVASPTLLDGYKKLKGSAIDPYSSVKNGYTQSRRAKIAE